MSTRERGKPAKFSDAGRGMRNAVVAVFFVQGFLFASWTAHIPHVKDHLHLSDGSLGIALLGAPAGSMLAMLAVSRLLPRLGSRRVVRMALVGYCLAGPLVGLSTSLVTFFIAFLLWGIFQGSLDVAMNAQAIAVEGRAGRRLMSGFHGSWSMGSLAGAGAGVLGVGLGWSLSEQLLIFAAPCLFVVGWLSTRMITDDHARVESPSGLTGKARWSLLQKAIVVLAAIAFADMFCEGAVADWTAVYLHGTLHTSAVVAGLGYAAYLLIMMTVRLLGNKVTNRFPVYVVLPLLAIIGTVGLGVGLIVNRPASVLVGFMCLGAGLALVVPMVFSACGHIANVHPGTAVATVSACGWTGFVLGPPLIGAIASLTSLRTALFLLPLLTAVVVVATG
ncbi:MAG TPA: MFS transporter, partial [Acidimicrobiales bacterium]|nr:MFS transporter [Acidimicrobiales bacterium]